LERVRIDIKGWRIWWLLAGKAEMQKLCSMAQSGAKKMVAFNWQKRSLTRRNTPPLDWFWQARLGRRRRLRRVGGVGRVVYFVCGWQHSAQRATLNLVDASWMLCRWEAVGQRQVQALAG
jgi:hypothetical protein